MAKKKQSESVYRIIDVVGVSEEFLGKTPAVRQ